MIKKYFSKPEPVHAVEFDGANEKEIARLLLNTGYTMGISRTGNVASLTICKGIQVVIQRAMMGDIIIRYQNGKVRVAKPDEFLADFTEEQKVKPKTE
jgi:hypothetical protein